MGSGNNHHKVGKQLFSNYELKAQLCSNKTSLIKELQGCLTRRLWSAVSWVLSSFWRAYSSVAFLERLYGDRRICMSKKSLTHFHAHCRFVRIFNTASEIYFPRSFWLLLWCFMEIWAALQKSDSILLLSKCFRDPSFWGFWNFLVISLRYCMLLNWRSQTPQAAALPDTVQLIPQKSTSNAHYPRTSVRCKIQSSFAYIRGDLLSLVRGGQEEVLGCSPCSRHGISVMKVTELCFRSICQKQDGIQQHGRDPSVFHRAGTTYVTGRAMWQKRGSSQTVMSSESEMFPPKTGELKVSA